MMKLRILARAEITLFKAEANRRGNQATLAAISIGCVFVGLIFVNAGFFFLLTESAVDSRAAFILAAGNFGLAIIPFLLRRNSKPGPEEKMVRDIRDMASDELSKDVESVSDEVAAVGSSLKQLKAGVSSFGGGGMGGAIGPILPIVIDLLKKSKK